MKQNVYWFFMYRELWLNDCLLCLGRVGGYPRDYVATIELGAII